MQSATLKFIVIGIIILIFGGVGYYVYRSSSSPKTLLPENAGTAPQTNNAPPVPAQASPQPRVGLNLKNKSTLAIGWQDVPAGTSVLNIYRSPKGKNAWIRWQAISVSQNTNGENTTLTNGTTDILIGQNENLSSYGYYFQAISGSGDSLFTSGIGQSQSSPPSSQSPGQPQNRQSSSFNLGGSGSSSSSAPIGGFNLTMAANTSTNQTQNSVFNQSNTATSSAQTIQTATGTPPVNQNPPVPPVTTSTTPKSIPTGTVSVAVQGIYYSPDGTPTGSGTQEANFWVLRVHEDIEIGWQNLPPNTDNVIIHRSASPSGPWTKLLEQRYPVLDQPSFLRLVDNTIGSAHSYRLSAYGRGTIITIYGPVLLPAE